MPCKISLLPSHSWRTEARSTCMVKLRSFAQMSHAAAADSDDAKYNTIFLLLPHPPPKQLTLVPSPFRADSMYRDDPPFDFSSPFPET